MWSRRSTRDAPDKATPILQQIFQEFYDEVNARDCNQVISAWNKTRNRKDAPKQAFVILEQMIDVYDKHGNDSVRPTGATYNFVIDTFAQKGDIENSCMVFDMQVSDFETKQNVKAKPNLSTFGSLIYACSYSRDKNAAEISKGILARIIDWHEKGKLKEGPNMRILITVMNACARNGDVEGAYSILEMMENSVYKVPYIRAYSILINAWSKSKKADSPAQARSVLQELIDMHFNGYIEEGPDVVAYTSVIDTYASRGDPQGASDILKMMEDDFEAGNKDAKPNTHTYNTLIHAWSKSGKDDSPAQARSILQKLISNNSSGYLNEGPDVITYSSVINAYAIRGDIDGATDVLEMMEADFESGNTDAKPNIRTYGILIHAWSKSGQVHAPHEAKNILDRVIDLHSKGDLKEAPNTIIFGAVMDAYAEQGDTQGASDILKMMEDDFESGNKGAKPDIRAYNTLIHAWSKSGQVHAPHEAKNILDRVIDLHSKGDLKEAPNTIIFGAVMDAYAEQGDTQGASEVNDMMKNAFKAGNTNGRPNSQTYTILIKAWGKSSKKNAPEEVEKILQEINDLHTSGDLQDGPDKVTYSSMIYCLQRFKGTEKRVEELKNLKKSCK
jgi:pentatricopeptide repeat protein